jgi:hypothetical protein
MKTLRITGVPEHFNYPWKKVIARQPFLSEGIKLEWIDESRGSGQMNQALRENETELALILTESFLKDFEAGNPSKMIGFHVNSPLVWGIHIPGGSIENSVNELKKHDFLISRLGSGSHLMAFVLAQRENWKTQDLEFKIVGNLPGALEHMNPAHPEIFLWEKFTTKPWVDSGEMKRIGEVPSPWACFVVVTSNAALKEFGEVIFQLRDLVYSEALKLKGTKSTISEISQAYELNEKDLEFWFAETNWATKPVISRKELNSSMEKMVELGILKSIQKPEDFLIMDRLTVED